MGRARRLNQQEQGQILAFRRTGWSIRKIAREIGRCHCVVLNFLKNPAKYGQKKSPGRKKKLSGRDERHIVNLASNTTKSCSQIRSELQLDASVPTVWRALKRSPNIVRSKMISAPRLLPRHKEARLKFARQNMSRNWKKVIFSDEKKFNLDGPDGFNGYWRDLRKEPRFFSKRNFGGGSVMVWGAFCSSEKLEIQFVSHKMKSHDYINVLKASLLPVIRRKRRAKPIFQQDNARVHTSAETMAWLRSEKIEVLDWPACSPDLNPIENLWGIMVRRIYADNRQFSSIQELKTAIFKTWEEIELTTLQTLILGMPNRIFQTINRSGGLTDY